MKLLQNVPTITKAIIVVGMLGACQNEKDAIVSPVAEQAEQTNNLKTNVSYYFRRLVGDDKIALTYGGPQKMLQTQVDQQSSEFTIYSLNYSKDKLLASHFTGANENKTKIGVSEFILNSEGKCIESHHTVSSSPNETVYKYEYNTDGLLEKAYNKNSPSERQEFTYSLKTTGKFNLSKIKFYNANNVETKQLAYSYYSVEEDIAKINPECLANGRGKYIPIFGYFKVNQIKQIVETTFVGNPVKEYKAVRSIKYTLNGLTETVKEDVGNYVVTKVRQYKNYGLL
ncbi:hypothetical protein [Dyadobacter alkalitolerans]|uniref:hypothetical protein n=1 Tax=Dyadobacter alkalitolerans TaxID=492736 RepID=UPI000478E8AF|nr:hypothetical protein [Dyadobacter alkalitolerans]